MNSSRNSVALIACMQVALSACSFQQLTIAPTIDTEALASDPIANSGDLRISVPLAEDGRNGESVGIRNDARYGAPVTTADSIPDILTQALRKTLAARGYVVTDDKPDAILKVRILESWTQIQSGFWASKIQARVVLLATLIKPANGQLLWSKGFTSIAEKGRAQMDSRQHRELALSQALTEAVGQLLADPALRRSIVEATNASSA